MLSPYTKRLLLAKSSPEMALISFMQEMEAKHDKMMAEMKDKMEFEIQKKLEEYEMKVTGTDAFDKAGGNLTLLMSKIQMPKDGINGKDADEYRIMQNVLARIPVPENGKDGYCPVSEIDYPSIGQIQEMVKCEMEAMPKYNEQIVVAKVLSQIKITYPKIEVKGEDIVKEINQLPIQPEFQIDAKHIKNLPKAQRQKPMLGGGGSAMKTEHLSPTLSGANITLNLSQLSRSWSDIQMVTRQGQVLERETVNGWTRSGNTITVYNATTDESFQICYTY